MPEVTREEFEEIADKLGFDPANRDQFWQLKTPGITRDETLIAFGMMVILVPEAFGSQPIHKISDFLKKGETQ